MLEPCLILKILVFSKKKLTYQEICNSKKIAAVLDNFEIDRLMTAIAENASSCLSVHKFSQIQKSEPSIPAHLRGSLYYSFESKTSNDRSSFDPFRKMTVVKLSRHNCYSVTHIYMAIQYFFSIEIL